MCVGVPMRLKEIDYPVGVAEAEGVEMPVYLHLIPEEELAPGDWVIVHVGFAIQKIRPEEARETWRLLREIEETVGHA
ncbi:HypC/HybG/HupF family hydrogenase formation chaperone [Thermosulfurimonas sp. F29]|uniref:HypC/HybG/HupF family hydrogenase formation chaperone n=1 Tax=Thermosulfurimonas sp. F29 TaxID=2867247 RepID=UPI001C83F639|nr:HypC/HybG/HupF family hydrogenase formation chaperone [Thermosulfurimonas sp. F29]MBX6424038.1 HypC/HybG/HupF family hydrogenase formation chaperone [Thermosulfurimonas sp. F29]